MGAGSVFAQQSLCDVEDGKRTLRFALLSINWSARTSMSVRDVFSLDDASLVRK